MSYCNSYNQDSSMYGLQGTSRRDLDEASRKDMDYCRDKMSCLPPYNYMLVSGSGTNVKCKCITKEQADRAVDGGIVIRPDGGRYNRAYSVGYGNIIRSQGVGGLNESFLESLGSLGNLAIIGLAIYGGFCLAKKL